MNTFASEEDVSLNGEEVIERGHAAHNIVNLPVESTTAGSEEDERGVVERSESGSVWRELALGMLGVELTLKSRLGQYYTQEGYTPSTPEQQHSDDESREAYYPHWETNPIVEDDCDDRYSVHSNDWSQAELDHLCHVDCDDRCINPQDNTIVSEQQ